MIRFKCGHCGEKLSVPEQYAGRKGKCPGCGQLNRVPSAEQAARPAEIPFPKKSPAPASVAPTQPFTWNVPTPPPAPAELVAEKPQTETAATPSQHDLSDPTQRYSMFTEVTERPDRWTRGPLKLEEGEAPAHHGALFHKTSEVEEEADGVLTLTRGWKVDRKGKLPKPVRIALLTAAVVGIIGTLWGVFYLLLKLIILVNE